MMVAAVATGVVFKRLDNRAQEEPEVGRVVRVKKGWKRERWLADWDQFNALMVAESGLTPAKLLTPFDHRSSGERLRVSTSYSGSPVRVSMTLLTLERQTMQPI